MSTSSKTKYCIIFYVYQFLYISRGKRWQGQRLWAIYLSNYPSFNLNLDMTGLSRRLPTCFTQLSDKSRTAAVQTGPVNMKTIMLVLTFPTCFVAIKSIRSVNTSYGIENINDIIVKNHYFTEIIYFVFLMKKRIFQMTINVITCFA